MSDEYDFNYFVSEATNRYFYDFEVEQMKEFPCLAIATMLKDPNNCDYVYVKLLTKKELRELVKE